MSGLLFLCLSTLSFSAPLRQVLASHRRPQVISLCEGIAQELITQFGGGDSSGLLVVPRAASLRYRHSSKSIAEIGRELHADYLLEGNVRGDARHVRVTVELIRASDETRVWGDEFNREPGDSLALESELAAAIAGKIRSAIFSGPAR